MINRINNTTNKANPPAKAKKLGGGSTAHKSPIGSTNNQWRIKNPLLIKVSLYYALLHTSLNSSIFHLIKWNPNITKNQINISTYSRYLHKLQK